MVGSADLYERPSAWRRGPRSDSFRLFLALPADADPFYRALWVHPGDEPVVVPVGFAIVVVLDGAGELRWEA